MGNSQSPDKVNEFKHQALGSVALITSRDSFGRQINIMSKVVPVQSRAEYVQWQAALNEIKNGKTAEVIFFPSNCSFKESGMCGSSGHVELIFQDYIFVLDNQIKNRQGINRPFLETEVWYLLYNLVRAAKEFQQLEPKQKIGDIRPANIVINQDGHIKIVSMRSLPQGLDNYSKAIQSRDQEVFLAPEECVDARIKSGVYPSGVDCNAAEVFSIGLTLLQASSLVNCGLLYSRSPNYSFDEQRLQQIKRSIKGRYSNPLTETIYSMLEVDPYVRCKATQICNFLSYYQEQILNLQAFEIRQHQLDLQPPQGHIVRLSTIPQKNVLSQQSNFSMPPIQLHSEHSQLHRKVGQNPY